MLVFVRMTVMDMLFTYTTLDQRKVGLYEQQRKKDVADTSRQTHRNKKDYKHTGDYTRRKLGLTIHQDMGTRCPRTYQHMKRVRKFRPGKEVCDQNP